MARATTHHVCTACGREEPKWHGRCPGCGEWGTLVEEAKPVPVAAGNGRARVAGGRALTPVPLADVEAPRVARLRTGIGELDRVLGGGLVPGSLVLLGGSPGIGKSTIVTMALGNLATSMAGPPGAAASHAGGGSASDAADGAGGIGTSGVLYVSGEESAAQVRLRAERLGPAALSVPIVAETDLEAVVATIEAERPAVCVVDSVQVLHAAALSGAPGSVGQVREVAGRLMRVAKTCGVAIVLVGHVTKEGALAGPRVLEHLVDCVLSFEGERERTYRTLRALKNRFGSTNEAGVFEMRDEGLVEVEDASARFVAEATATSPGSAILCAMEGSRPLLVEVQALVAPTELVPPRRMANGIDRNRLALVLAVLSRHARIPRARDAQPISLASADIFVSVAGGVRVDEPGADLAIALAIASATAGVPLAPGGRPLAAFGEVGLTGELRHVAHPDRRLAEAAKFGLEPVLRPGEGLPTLSAALRTALGAPA